MEFLPETDEGKFTISMETKVESPFERTEEKVAQIERIVMDYLGGDLQSMSSIIGQGGSSSGLGATGSHLGRISVVMTKKDRRQRSIWKAMNDLTAAIRSRVTEVKFTIKAEGLSSLVSLAAGSESPVVVELAGEDLDASETFAQRVADVLKSVRGTRNVQVSYQTGKPELQFRVKRREAVSLGLSPMEIAATIRAAYKGMTVSRFKRDDETFDVYLILRDEDRNSLSRIGGMFLVNRAGTRIPLENVVDVTEAGGPVSIERVNKTRMIKVTSALTGERPLNRVVEDVRKGVDALGAPPSGIKQAISGSTQQMSDAFSSLFFALLLGIGLVYVVMANQFESLLHPFIIMFSIPFALVGLTAALLATNTTFSLVAFIGAILLVGYVVNTAIVLVDYINILRRSGIPLDKAISIGGRTRLKPVIMSVGTTLLGLFPMAIGLGTGSEMWASLARAVFGGLLSSTVITLVLVPVIYYLVESKLRRKKPL
jgi:HAE1 family hydrophobic/amphiphilic exporter-1